MRRPHPHPRTNEDRQAVDRHARRSSTVHLNRASTPPYPWQHPLAPQDISRAAAPSEGCTAAPVAMTSIRRLLLLLPPPWPSNQVDNVKGANRSVQTSLVSVVGTVQFSCRTRNARVAEYRTGTDPGLIIGQRPRSLSHATQLQR